MYGNGAKIGMASTVLLLKPTPKVLQAASTVCCAAAAGSRIAVLPTAPTPAHLSAVATSVFGWCFPGKQLGFCPSFLSLKKRSFAKRKEGRLTESKTNTIQRSGRFFFNTLVGFVIVIVVVFNTSKMEVLKNRKQYF